MTRWMPDRSRSKLPCNLLQPAWEFSETPSALTSCGHFEPQHLSSTLEPSRVIHSSSSLPTRRDAEVTGQRTRSHPPTPPRHKRPSIDSPRHAQSYSIINSLLSPRHIHPGPWFCHAIAAPQLEPPSRCRGSSTTARRVASPRPRTATLTTKLAWSTTHPRRPRLLAKRNSPPAEPILPRPAHLRPSIENRQTIALRLNQHRMAMSGRLRQNPSPMLVSGGAPCHRLGADRLSTLTVSVTGLPGDDARGVAN